MKKSNDEVKTLYLSSPTLVEITLTKQCNHKCLHCYNPWRANIKNNSKEFTEEQIKILVNELKRNDVWHVTISGGEPLFNLKNLYILIEELIKADIKYSINTNLTLLTENISKKLKEEYKFDAYLITSLPSLKKKKCDFITQSNESYERIIKGIEIAKKYQHKVGINIVITQYNISDLDEIVTFTQKYNIDYVSVSIVIPPSYDFNNTNYYLTDEDIIKVADTLINLNENYNIEVDSITPLPLCILKDINKYEKVINTTCSAGLTRCTIDTEGEIFACSHEEKSYGNIFKDGLKVPWNKMDKWRNCSNLNKKCLKCKFIALCGGECRMQKPNNINEKYNINPNADMIYEIFDDIIEIDYHKKYKLNSNIKVRKEKFGAIIKNNYNDFFVSSEIFMIYSLVKKDFSNGFYIKDLEKYIEIDEDFSSILQTLIAWNIFI
ncbi:MAG: radical SAM protein [Bacilli bacterium]|nr:radical SAM protein [Bacilli bacterium]